MLVTNLKNYTDKLVFSFADIKIYKKVQNNLRSNSIPYQEFNERTMNEFATGLQHLNENWNFELATCAEQIPLEKYGIIHNKCVDDDLMIKLFSHEPIASTGFAVLSCCISIYNYFLFYYLLSPIFDCYANSSENSKGMAYPAINDDKKRKAANAVTLRKN